MALASERKTFCASEKVAILRRHLLDKVPVSGLCDAYGVSPNVFYRWQKAFFENGAAFCERCSNGRERKLEQQVAAQAGRLADKDEVIAEITEARIAPKERLGRPEGVLDGTGCPG